MLISKKKDLGRSGKVKSEMQNMSSLIESFFAPDSCLQGSEFPMHLIWDQEQSINVHLTFPSRLVSLKEIYNVNKRELKIGTNSISMDKFETNGYVGFVFKTNICKEPSIEAPIRVRIGSGAQPKQVIEHNLLLFRPHIVKFPRPKEIDVELREDEPYFKDKILVKNEGKGTAIIKLDIAGESDIHVRMPREMERFVEKFCSTLITKSRSVKKDYPGYSPIVDGFVDLVVDSAKGSFTITEEYVQKMQDTFDKISKAFEENEDFFRDLLQAILSAYLSSVHLITEIHSLFEYLKSLAENKVLLLNAASELELKPGSNRILGHLRIQDLVPNVYKPIEIDINVSVNSDRPVMIPLYSIFDWSGGRK